MQCDPHGQVDIGLRAGVFGLFVLLLYYHLFIGKIRLLLVVYVVVRGSRSNNRGGKKKGRKEGKW